jgi:peptidyl-prolyl cis-trans isomerase C
MRLTSLSVLALAAGLMAPAAFADAPAPDQASSDPVVATVNGMQIHMSDIQKAAQDAPQQLQQMPPNQLFPLLLNQEIDRAALLVAARAEDLEKQPDVAAAMAHAANVSLENAYVQQHVTSSVSDAAVQAAYNKEYAGKPGAEEVEARHILVKTKAEAEAIITQLNHGANFATLAEKDSIDPGAKNGGELGWFTKDQMVPSFANAAFALQPGQYTKTPVQSQFGWHVILVEGRRAEPTPALADVQDQIRQTLADNAIQATLAAARAKVKITINTPAGSQAAPAAPASH